MEFVTFLALVVIFVLLVIVRNELSEVKGSIDKVARELHRLSSGAGDRLPEMTTSRCRRLSLTLC